MTRFTNILIQLGGMAGQILNIWGGFIPPKAQGYVAAGLGTMQLITAVIASSYNPNGTPATVPYNPAETKAEFKARQ